MNSRFGFSTLGNSAFSPPNMKNSRFRKSRFGMPNIIYNTENFSKIHDFGQLNMENANIKSSRFGNSRFGLKIIEHSRFDLPNIES